MNKNHLKQRLQLLAGLDVKPGNIAFQIYEGTGIPSGQLEGTGVPSGMLNEKRRRKRWLQTLIDIGKTIGSVITAWGWLSDRRVKTNIILVGKSPSGINIYEYEYKPNLGLPKGRYRGVMANEVPGNAQMVNENTGLLYVDYNKIDVDFIKLDSISTGGKILYEVRKPLAEGHCAEGMYMTAEGHCMEMKYYNEELGQDAEGELDDDDKAGFDVDKDVPIIEPMDRPTDMGTKSPMSVEEQRAIGAKLEEGGAALAILEDELLNSGRPSVREFGVGGATEWIAMVRRITPILANGQMTRQIAEEVGPTYKKWWNKLLRWIDNFLHECDCPDGSNQDWGPCPSCS
tara:strand:- start:2725 stop:3756 length:1032 start_codon:yes stop_codon:yes gene_type:complete